MKHQSVYRNWFFINQATGNQLAQEQDKRGILCDSGGGVKMAENQQAIRQSIGMILSTIPGERVMRREFGCDLHRLVFAPNDETTAGLAIHYITNALSRWEKRIEITQVDAFPCKDNSAVLEIMIAYRIKILDVDDQINFLFNLSGEN